MSQQQFDLPVKINILGNWVTIKYVDHIPSDNDFIHGIFELEKSRITIRISHADEMYKTLVHEITHAIFAYSGLGQVINERQEEGICCAFEYFTKLFHLRKSRGFIKFQRKR